jgi:hypothetical protein
VTILLLAVLVLNGDQAAGQTNFELLRAPGAVDWANFSLSRTGDDMGCLLNGAVYWWSRKEGFRFLDPGSPRQSGVGMAAGGGALVASKSLKDGSATALWYADGTSIILDPPLKACRDESTQCGGFDLSSDGSVVVGLAANCETRTGFVWSRKAGLDPLPGPEAGQGEGLAVSADGNTIVGFTTHTGSDDPCPTLWRRGADPASFMGADVVGKALNVSLDGRYVVGQASLGRPAPSAFVWTEGKKPLVLDNPPGLYAEPGRAVAVSDGGVVVGWAGDEIFGSQVAFVWSPTSGLRLLEDVLAEMGATLPEGLVLTGALDISGDGTTIVGTCRDRDFKLGIWRIRLDNPAALGPLDISAPVQPGRPGTASRDSLDIDQADMLLPFPFGKRGHGQLNRP